MFIPAAVVERAGVLLKKLGLFSLVLHELAREGNGTWPRNTLRRRLELAASSAVQNSQASSSPAAAAEQLEDVFKTRYLVARLERAVAVAEYGTPDYHRALAALHKLDGRCGCNSCGFARRKARA